MRSHCLVLCLALMTASVGFAQTPVDAPLAGAEDTAPAPPDSQSDEELEEPLAEIEDEEQFADSEPPPAGPAAPPGEMFPYDYKPQNEAPRDLVLPRILAETFGGVVGGVGMGIAGLLVGVSALEDMDCSDGDVCLATLAVITVPAVFVGIPLGVQTAAEGLGGRGAFVPALMGTLVGTGAGIAYGLTGEGNGRMVAGLIIGPLFGSIVGYEISNAMAWRREYGAKVASHAGPRVVPVVGATPRGGFLGGLSGSF